MKRANTHWIYFVLCFALLSNIGLTGAESKPIIVPSTMSAPNPPIDPVSGLPFNSRSSAFSSPSIATIASTLWTKYAGNPVLNVGSSGSWDSNGAASPSVVFKDGNYKLWYSGYSGPNSSYRIGLATSSDGVNWTKSLNNPVLTVGASGTWDSGYVIAPHVIFHNGIYKMWYRGTSDPSTPVGASIGYATSMDGVNWDKHAGNPVLSVGPSGSWDSKTLWSGYVIVEGSTYKMWYAGCNDSDCRIGYATSPDGINWTKYAGNPVLSIGSSENWDSIYVYYPNVIFNGSIYEMWYSGFNGSTFAIGYATSTDGINWNKHPNNPVITTGPTGSWESNVVIASSVIAQTSTYKMWYTGYDASNVVRIGYAVSSTGTDLGFRPNPNGYRFANYGGNFPLGSYDFRYEDLIRMFGQDAVCWMVGPVCLVKPSADLWHLRANLAMNGGHCDGMASTSLRFFKGLDNPASFQAGANTTHDLQLNDIRQHIAYYFVEQLTDPVRAYKEQVRQNTPSAILNQLRSAMSSGAPDPTTLFVRQAGRGGHAITPYAIEDQSNGVYWVKVYDNNYPDDANRHVVITTTTDTWSYNLGGGLGTWSGDTNTRSLGVVPISEYATQPVCPWCKGTSATSTPNELSSGQIWLTGRGHLLISDTQGRRIGYVGNQFVSEIPGAYGGIIDGGTGIEMEPIYTLPLSETFTILLDGQTVTQTETVAVTQFGPGYAVAAENVVLSPTSHDQLTVLPDGTQLAYQSNSAKEATLTLALDGISESNRFTVKGADIGSGQTVTLTVNTISGQMVFTNKQTGSGEYNLDIKRVSPAGEKWFTHADIDISAMDTHYIDYGAWDGSGPITLRVDHDSNGTIDETLVLDNQVRRVYLPIVLR